MCFWGFYIDFIPINKESREKLRFIDKIGDYSGIAIKSPIPKKSPIL